uniref:Uncharacterized protein n=1 Tax=uncultured marine virus TaxID=186617 RepID=A0A0F7L2V4_9VIRU|nr:hypothetical protein [uncultured marine virus]
MSATTSLVAALSCMAHCQARLTSKCPTSASPHGFSSPKWMLPTTAGQTQSLS